MACGCGRSPTGQCIGWHSLTEEQYKKKLEEYNQTEFVLVEPAKKDQKSVDKT
jgi:hypothetical protein